MDFLVKRRRLSLTFSNLRVVLRDNRLSFLLLSGVFASVPIWAPNLWFVRIFIIGNLFAIFALSWNLLVGYTGQISFGHAFFFGGGSLCFCLVK